MNSPGRFAQAAVLPNIQSRPAAGGAAIPALAMRDAMAVLTVGKSPPACLKGIWTRTRDAATWNLVTYAIGRNKVSFRPGTESREDFGVMRNSVLF
jgi:hypothetical protein